VGKPVPNTVGALERAIRLPSGQIGDRQIGDSHRSLSHQPDTPDARIPSAQAQTTHAPPSRHKPANPIKSTTSKQKPGKALDAHAILKGRTVSANQAQNRKKRAQNRSKPLTRAGSPTPTQCPRPGPGPPNGRDENADIRGHLRTKAGKSGREIRPPMTAQSRKAALRRTSATGHCDAGWRCAARSGARGQVEPGRRPVLPRGAI
jgi:hypothetical protein